MKVLVLVLADMFYYKCVCDKGRMTYKWGRFDKVNESHTMRETKTKKKNKKNLEGPKPKTKFIEGLNLKNKKTKIQN